tara:strand:+ start:204 stop:440 length:237 start_codon:yes stop_codon:yes gene_type:complete
MTEKKPEFMNRSRFTKLIETQVLDKRLSYIDAVVEVCDQTSIDPEDVKKFISPVIKEKIEAEAMKLNYLPKQNELTFE